MKALSVARRAAGERGQNVVTVAVCAHARRGPTSQSAPRIPSE